jgi:hypothetical protein
MAVQIETQGQLAEFLEILSRRRWQLLLPALVVLAFGTALAVFIPKKFLVATQVEVRPVSVNLSGKEADNAPNQLRSIERIRSLVQTLKYAPYLVLGPGEQAQFVNDARGDLKVTVETPSRASAATSSFVRIEYTHADVNWAMEFLKALRDDWKKDVIDAEKNRVDDEAARQEEKVSQLEAQIKHEEDELNGLYQRNNISPTQPIPGGNEQRAEDPDFERLQRAKDKLWQEQNDLTRAEQRVAQLEVQLANEPEKLSEEQLLEGVNTSAELVGIEKDIVDLNAELARYRPQHSNYLQILKKIEDLEKKRDAIRRVATKNELTSVAKVNPHYRSAPAAGGGAQRARRARCAPEAARGHDPAGHAERGRALPRLQGDPLAQQQRQAAAGPARRGDAQARREGHPGARAGQPAERPLQRAAGGAEAEQADRAQPLADRGLRAGRGPEPGPGPGALGRVRTQLLPQRARHQPRDGGAGAGQRGPHLDQPPAAPARAAPRAGRGAQRGRDRLAGLRHLGLGAQPRAALAAAARAHRAAARQAALRARCAT